MTHKCCAIHQHGKARNWLQFTLRKREPLEILHHIFDTMYDVMRDTMFSYKFMYYVQRVLTSHRNVGLVTERISSLYGQWDEGIA